MVTAHSVGIRALGLEFVSLCFRDSGYTGFVWFGGSQAAMARFLRRGHVTKEHYKSYCRGLNKYLYYSGSLLYL